MSKSALDEIYHLVSVAQNKEDYGVFEFLAASILYKFIYLLISGKNILQNTKIYEKTTNRFPMYLNL